MTQTYLFTWSISGTTRITAESQDEAVAKFQMIDKRDLSDDGELEDVPDPTLEARDDE